MNVMRKLAEISRNDGAHEYIVNAYLDAASAIDELLTRKQVIELMDTDYIPTPKSEFMKKEEVLSIFPVSKTSWDRGVANGIYPKPVNIGMRSIAWKKKDIHDLIERVNNGWFSE